ncbi:esterase-like activity of phytase family protein [Amnibacterium setariae]|uniref:Esterase-like activity of phytase family protein n=1 Tax=Amnibacterium setariae TaxID=2306585 RepID=A0A3A1TUG9_9MICO|nr:esterase-like activity of phytase family protein [Amnibacterium setariae]RIX27872.1 esterase-like activity of phytase family protein [Amnibacterium setariae]
MRTSIPIAAVLAACTLTAAAAVSADASPFGARNDAYRVSSSAPTTVPARHGVLRNDSPAFRQIVDSTQPTSGDVTLRADGGFRYSPTGTARRDSFTYTTSDAVRVYSEDEPPLATIGGVEIGGSGFGSAVATVPGHPDQVYGLTDRGPNVDGPGGSKIEPLPDFTPSIGRFRLRNGKAELLQTIPLRAEDGHRLNGQVNPAASTNETITDLDGAVLPASRYGLDSEGLVAMPDGTFYVSDEYGPFIVHFDRHGRELERFSPQAGTLPAELGNRTPNKGMEGLTVTPDGRTLVGIMQSALTQPDATAKPGKNPLVRIVTIDLKTKRTHEYPYLLQDPGDTSSAVSEITALSSTRFLVDERDGEFEPGAFKRLYVADIANATDIGPRAAVAGAAYSSTLGLTVGGKSLEALVGKATTAQGAASLAAAGITPAAKSLRLDLGALLTSLNPQGAFFGHDKIEGVAVTDRGRKLIVSNDSDFGIAGTTGDTAPFTLAPKTGPDGKVDAGEFLVVDLTKVQHPTSTATVSLNRR